MDFEPTEGEKTAFKKWFPIAITVLIVVILVWIFV